MRQLRVAVARAIARWLHVPMVLRLVAPVTVMVMLWILSSRPPAGGSHGFVRQLLSNGAHLVAYFALTASWLLALLPRGGARREAMTRALATTTFGLSVIYGVVDEVHQSFVPGRVPSIWDVATDACGSAVAILFVVWVLDGEGRFLARTVICLLFGCAVVLLGTVVG